LKKAVNTSKDKNIIILWWNKNLFQKWHERYENIWWVWWDSCTLKHSLITKQIWQKRRAY